MVKDPQHTDDMRHGFLRHRSRAAGLALAVAGLLVAGCGSPTGSTSGLAGGAKGHPSATSPASSAAGLSDFPVAVGNTWVFRNTLLGGTVTQKITAVTPVADGTKVLETNTVDFPGNSPGRATYTYVFHPDGSITYPPAQFAFLTPVQGAITWPDPSGLASGQPYRTTTTVQITVSPGLTGDETAHFTVQGAGSASVTVPAGTYRATVVDLTMAVDENGKPTSYGTRIWLADGIGPVQYEYTSVGPGGPSAPVITEGPTGPVDLKLQSFTKG